MTFTNKRANPETDPLAICECGHYRFHHQDMSAIKEGPRNRNLIVEPKACQKCDCLQWTVKLEER